MAIALGHKAVADLLLNHGARPVKHPERLLLENDSVKDKTLDFPTNFKAPTVAMAPVVIDDGWYSSLAAANDFEAALEADALALPEVHWVELAEIEKLGGEWATSTLGGNDASALQKGRLVRADWMVTTHILPDEGFGRRIVFEVVDTQTAEVLARHEIRLPGQVAWPFESGPARQPCQAGLRAVLAMAARTAILGRGRKRLACLFFANQTLTDRFFSFPGSAMEMMTSVSESSKQQLPHVVRFRRSQTVTGESELAAAGWLDLKGRAPEQVADAFAWGSITEAGNMDAPLNDVQIKLTWEVWAGNADTVKHEDICRVADARATLETLSARVLSTLPAKGDLANPDVRQTMADRLMDQAQKLRKGGNSGLLAVSRQHWRERVTLLEAAHFLNPERLLIEAALHTERWDRMMSSEGVTSERSLIDFRYDFQGHMACSRFLEALEPGQTDLNQVASAAYSDIETGLIGNRRWEMSRSLRRDIIQLQGGVPVDSPSQVREQWVAALTSEKDLVPLLLPPSKHVQSDDERFPDRKAKADMTRCLATELENTKNQPGWLPVSPEIRELPDYYSSGMVKALAIYKDKLFLVVNGNRPKYKSYATAVWERNMTKNTFTLVPDMEFQMNYDYIHLIAHSTGLWMWNNQNGIVHRDWETGVVTRHNLSTGLPTEQINCGAVLGDTLYFGGGRAEGALFCRDMASQSWRLLPRPNAGKERMRSVERIFAMGDELLVQAMPRYSAVNPSTKSWREMGKTLNQQKVAPWESCVTGKVLWSWGPEHFARVDLATMTHRPVVPGNAGLKVTGWLSTFAKSHDSVWAITREMRDGSWSGNYNINRLFAVNQDDATVQSAILLPLVCRVNSAAIVDQTLWLGVTRDRSDRPCLLLVPLPH